MKTVAQVLPPNALDEVIQQVAPAETGNEELVQFKRYLEKLDSKQVHALQEELQAAARVRGRKIVLREVLLSRIGTEWLRKQQELVNAELAKIEVAKDTADFNILELEMATQTWRLGKTTNVLRLDERADRDPLIGMIKQQEDETEAEVIGVDSMDDERLETLFGLR